MTYRFAAKEDIDFLVEARLAFTYDMKEKEVDKSSMEYKELEKNCYEYFNRAINENTCDVVLAELNGEFIGSGIIFYYYSVPSSFNTEGKRLYEKKGFCNIENGMIFDGRK